MRTLLGILVCSLVACGGVDPNMQPDSSDMKGQPGAGKFASDGGAAGVDGSMLPFLSPCSDNSQCASMVCNAYPAKGGSFCTKACTAATQAADCPSPSPGCNHMGLCKVP